MSASASARAAQSVQVIVGSQTLRQVLDQRRAQGSRLSLDEAISIIVPLCLDLKERHGRGERVYVHPSCVVGGADGLARIAQKRSVAPSDPRDKACLAPEALRSFAPGDARASVYSVGAILYEMVTGSAVGPGMRRPREVDPTLSEALEVLLSKALVGDPAHRPADLGALASAMHHLAPMKSIHPPDADESALDRAELEVDIRLSMLPPERAEPPPPSMPRSPGSGRPPPSGDPLGQVIHAPRAQPSGPSVAQQLASLKARLEADPRPRYVVNKDRMDHGPFNAVEVLQQIASNQFRPDHELRDELSGIARPIKEWEEFAPFAKHAAMARDIQAEKKAVAKAESAEKKTSALKVVVGLLLVASVLGAAAIWFFKVRGSRSDDVAIEDEVVYDLDIDGGIKGRVVRRAGGHGGGGGGGGGGFVAGMSFEAAQAANTETINIGGNAGPDLSRDQLAAPLKNGTILAACGTPDSTKVVVKAAVKMGRAVGVSVYTTPPNRELASCIDRRVRGLGWPVNPKMDFVTTSY
jgi:hypothetical protein